MNKFQKRLHKLSRNRAHALVLGSAFGILDQVVEIYDTVFVISSTQPSVKAKNLIYRQTIDRLDYIVNVGVVFLDMKHIGKLENLQTFWKKNNSLVLIEGNDVISRDLSKPLYDSGWRCTSLQGIFHVWEKQQ